MLERSPIKHHALQWITFGDYTEAISKIKESGIPIMVMVQSVEEAVKAAARGASAIVAQVTCSMLRHFTS